MSGVRYTVNERGEVVRMTQPCPNPHCPGVGCAVCKQVRLLVPVPAAVHLRETADTEPLMFRATYTDDPESVTYERPAGSIAAEEARKASPHRFGTML